MIKRFLTRFLPSILFTAVLLIIWEAAVRLFAIEEWMLPAPSAIWEEWTQIYDRIQPDILATTTIAVEGLLISLAVGVLIASFLHLSPILKQIIHPLLVFSQTIPIIILAPLLVMWLGFGILPKLLVIVLICFFPITISTLDGLAQTDRTLWTYMKIAGATRSQLFFKLEFPSALPSFFSGLKISATYSVMGAVIAEWLGAEYGLGMRMKLAASSFLAARVFVMLMLIVILSFLLFAIIRLIESRCMKWSLQEGERNR